LTQIRQNKANFWPCRKRNLDFTIPWRSPTRVSEF
jgi:hypothetical protein